MRLRRPLLRAALAAWVAASAPRARAGDLGVSPILIQLDAESPSALVTIQNAGQAPSRLTVKVYAWAQDSRGEMVLSPTADVVAFPPVLELAPGARRNLRIGTTLAPGADEQSYRLILEEMPGAAGPGGARVQVLSRIGVPVFVSARAPAPGLELGEPTFSPGKAVLSLRNTGNVHLRPASATAELQDAAGATLAREPLDVWYLLPHGERVLEVALPGEACRAAVTLAVTVVLDGKPARRTAPVPREACAP